MRAATELTAEIGDRFKVGDAAPELVARLAAMVATLERELALADTVPEDLRTAITELLALVQETTTAGGHWLATADGPELANYRMRVRVQKVYGLLDDLPP